MENTDNVERLDAWRKVWEQTDSPHHYRDYVHRLLLSNFSNYARGRQNLRVLVPLCGKSLDMKWLADQGHRVVGVEAVELPVKDFFRDQNIEHSVEVRGDHKLYQSEDGRITVHVTDLFALTRDDLGTFDIVWDRASFVALKKEQRRSYVALLKTVLGAGCRYMLCTVDMERASGDTIAGPPHTARRADLEELFGADYTVSLVERLDCTSDADPKWEVLRFHEVLFLITKR